jgi:hypothetical protein
VPVSDVDICNRALIRIGQKQLIASRTEDSVPAQLCDALFDQVRDEVLEAFPWPILTKHATLAQLTSTRSGWAYAYALPVDCLSPRYVFNGFRPGGSALPLASLASQLAASWQSQPLVAVADPIPFSLEMSDDGDSRVLVTDQPAAELIYTAASTAPGLWPPSLCNAIAWKLASELALGIPVKVDQHRLFDQQYRLALAEAGATALRGQRDDPEPDSDIITVRG